MQGFKAKPLAELKTVASHKGVIWELKLLHQFCNQSNLRKPSALEESTVAELLAHAPSCNRLFGKQQTYNR